MTYTLEDLESILDYPTEEIVRALQNLEADALGNPAKSLDDLDYFELAFRVEEEILDSREKDWKQENLCRECGEPLGEDHDQPFCDDCLAEKALSGEVKWCTTCKSYKLIEAFGHNCRRPDGVQSECKSCAANRQRAKRQGRSLDHGRNGEFDYDKYLKDYSWGDPKRFERLYRNPELRHYINYLGKRYARSRPLLREDWKVACWYRMSRCDSDDIEVLKTEARKEMQRLYRAEYRRIEQLKDKEADVRVVSWPHFEWYR